MKHFLITIVLFLTPTLSLADSPPNAGNFILRSSQQPGSLVGFGGNIIDKNETQINMLFDDYMGVGEHFIDFVPATSYGISDTTTITITIPYAVSYKSQQQHSNGFEDAYVQLEHAYYFNSTSRYTDQATFLGNLFIPTGSTQKNPRTGNGAVSFFLGGTFTRMYVDWFYFGGLGAVLPTTNRGSRNGNTYLYQFGFGRNIKDVNGWILAWVTEFDGTQTQHNRINNVQDPNSGGNVIYVTPSFWSSNNAFIFQIGAGYAVAQHWNGQQPRDTWLLVSNIGVSF